MASASSSDSQATSSVSVKNNITVSLQNADLWRSFHSLTNEMIVTKSGRKMFPVLAVKIEGLNPTSMYNIVLDFVQVDSHKWKYQNGEWMPSTNSESSRRRDQCEHPDSPNFGSYWMADVVSFHKVKLTNKATNHTGEERANKLTLLYSLHKYIPKIHIVKIGPNSSDKTVGVFSFEETAFVAVTAYQNEEITQLKIWHNPFAKGFQERRGRNSSEEKFNEEQMRVPSEQPFSQAPAMVQNTLLLGHHYTSTRFNPNYGAEPNRPVRVGENYPPCAVRASGLSPAHHTEGFAQQQSDCEWRNAALISTPTTTMISSPTTMLLPTQPPTHYLLSSNSHDHPNTLLPSSSTAVWPHLQQHSFYAASSNSNKRQDDCCNYNTHSLQFHHPHRH